MRQRSRSARYLSVRSNLFAQLVPDKRGTPNAPVISRVLSWSVRIDLQCNA